jgi:integrase
MLPRNVADATNPPVVQNKPIRPLNEQELVQFFQEAREDRYFAAYVLVATTGMRRGELCGLCWDSVDLEQGVAVVQRQMLVLKDGLSLEDTTKSKSGRRSIILTDDAVRELKAYRREQAKERLLLGPAYQDNNLVFCKEDGSPIDPRDFTKRFQRILGRAGLPKVRLHDLRHTHASLLLARGVHPKVVQERLGHSSITMTLDLYSHLTPGLQEAAAASLNGLVQKQEKKEVQ